MLLGLLYSGIIVNSFGLFGELVPNQKFSFKTVMLAYFS